MAVTPQPDEAFLREVDDAVRQDQLLSFWQRYGRWVVGVVAAALIAFAGYLYWHHHREQSSGVVAEKADALLKDMDAGKPADPALLATLEQSGQPGYRAIAALAKAGAAAQKGDVDGAAALYGAMAADTSLTKAYRDLATVRQVALTFDKLTPQQVVDRLKPLAVAGEPWFGSAGEMVAIAYMKMRKQELAGATFAAIAKDTGVPRSIRGRAAQMAGLLGVDVVGAIEN